MTVLEKIRIGSRVLHLGQILTLTEDLGNGEFRWVDTSEPPATGTITFEPGQEENNGLVVIG